MDPCDAGLARLTWGKNQHLAWAKAWGPHHGPAHHRHLMHGATTATAAKRGWPAPTHATTPHWAPAPAPQPLTAKVAIVSAFHVAAILVPKRLQIRSAFCLCVCIRVYIELHDVGSWCREVAASSCEETLRRWAIVGRLALFLACV